MSADILPFKKPELPEYDWGEEEHCYSGDEWGDVMYWICTGEKRETDESGEINR